ncbi:hypothetical protein N180_07620 [Pedobacter antarcticus 4BY]|uniref:Uncharacterized protein n=2 Tax=Pedobacter antarcticus TaxID=34086 RepID=A0A081PKX5_9SPHI|nr:hypothetical protein [Pedobacter antarcticus]KEQ31348.1 hypothetical protein N180_07620 [Pedobacter antarcticus 4BY]SFE37711.1 hypothetical protein SAMN03003324_00274 [Pedobacter antarcticus]
MKKLILTLLFGTFILSNTYAQKYFGKTYTPTQNVDEFYANADVTKEYTVMGKTELDKGFRSLEKTQAKIIELAKKKGADGVIFTMDEEVVATTSSGSGSVNTKKANKATGFSSSTTTDIKEKKIRATFIKYK